MVKYYNFKHRRITNYSSIRHKTYNFADYLPQSVYTDRKICEVCPVCFQPHENAFIIFFNV